MSATDSSTTAPANLSPIFRAGSSPLLLKGAPSPPPLKTPVYTAPPTRDQSLIATSTRSR